MPKKRKDMRKKRPEEFSPRVASVFNAMSMTDARTTSAVADRVMTNKHWLGKTRAQVLQGVASVCYDLRKAGWMQSWKTNEDVGGRGEYLHQRFVTRHAAPQRPVRAVKGTAKGNGTKAPPAVDRPAEPDTSPLNRVIAAAGRIEKDVKVLEVALISLMEQLEAYKGVEEAIQRLKTVEVRA